MWCVRQQVGGAGAGTPMTLVVLLGPAAAGAMGVQGWLTGDRYSPCWTWVLPLSAGATAAGTAARCGAGSGVPRPDCS